MRNIYIDENDDKKIAHYSPAVEHNNIIYISGQLPINKGETRPNSSDIKIQTQIVLEKLQTILEKAGSKISNVLRTTIYLTDISFWDEVNSVYAEFFSQHRPARTIIPVANLHFNCLIELEAIAYID
ncbi:MAG: RidA family protein [Candidatus Heimdallarchaeota archaeon]|nr:RidA family protein [Candidatus Heimdallarchaeota archaeon]